VSIVACQKLRKWCTETKIRFLAAKTKIRFQKQNLNFEFLDTKHQNWVVGSKISILGFIAAKNAFSETKTTYCGSWRHVMFCFQEPQKVVFVSENAFLRGGPAASARPQTHLSGTRTGHADVLPAFGNT